MGYIDKIIGDIVANIKKRQYRPYKNRLSPAY